LFSIARRKIINCGFFLTFGVCFVILTGSAASSNAEVNIDIRSAGVGQTVDIVAELERLVSEIIIEKNG